jgi:hypothetical protein
LSCGRGVEAKKRMIIGDSVAGLLSSYVHSTRVVVRLVKKERMYFLAAAEVCMINQFGFQGLDLVD